MNTHADKNQDNTKQSLAGELSNRQKGGASPTQFYDYRPEAETQRQLQEMAGRSPQTMQMKALQKAIGHFTATSAGNLPLPPNANLKTNGASTPEQHLESATVQRQIDFDPYAKKIHTPEEYLNLLHQAALKKYPNLDFNTFINYWRLVEEHKDHLIINDDISHSWEVIEQFIGSNGIKVDQSNSQEQGKLGKKDYKLAMEISRSSMAGKTKVINSVNKAVGPIYPPINQKDPVSGKDEKQPFADGNSEIDYLMWQDLSKEEQEKINRYLYPEDDGEEAKEALIQDWPTENSAYNLLVGKLLTADLNLDELGFSDYFKKLIDIREGRTQDNVPQKYNTPSSNERDYTAWQKNIPSIMRPFQRQRGNLKKGVEERGGGSVVAAIRSYTKGANLGAAQNLDILLDDYLKAPKKEKKDKKNELDLALARARDLDNALSQLPTSVGTVYGIYPENDSLKEGMFFSQGAPLSTSESLGSIANFGRDGKMDLYLIEATGDSGHNIAEFSSAEYRHQREVLFRARARFVISGIRKPEGDEQFVTGIKRVIMMREVSSKINPSLLPTSNEEISKNPFDSLKIEGADHLSTEDLQLLKSQKYLLNSNAEWLTKLEGVSKLHPALQNWFISNATGGWIEGNKTASFQFPYGRDTASRWHSAINYNDNDIWELTGFKKIVGILEGKDEGQVKPLSKKDSRDKWWGNPTKLDKKQVNAAKSLGLNVKKGGEKGTFDVFYKVEAKQGPLTQLLQNAQIIFNRISQIQDLETKKQEGAKFAAHIQQQLSVLHPLEDTNGRMSRAYGHIILKKLGLPDPEYGFNQNDDQTTSSDEWQDSFANSYTKKQKHNPQNKPENMSVSSIPSNDRVKLLDEVEPGFLNEWEGASSGMDWYVDSVKKNIRQDPAIEQWIVDELLELEPVPGLSSGVKNGIKQLKSLMAKSTQNWEKIYELAFNLRETVLQEVLKLATGKKQESSIRDKQEEQFILNWMESSITKLEPTGSVYNYEDKRYRPFDAGSSGNNCFFLCLLNHLNLSEQNRIAIIKMLREMAGLRNLEFAGPDQFDAILAINGIGVREWALFRETGLDPQRYYGDFGVEPIDIVHVGGNHWQVLKEVAEEEVEIIDPGHLFDSQGEMEEKKLPEIDKIDNRKKSTKRKYDDTNLDVISEEISRQIVQKFSKAVISNESELIRHSELLATEIDRAIRQNVLLQSIPGYFLWNVVNNFATQRSWSEEIKTRLYRYVDERYSVLESIN